MIPGSVLGMALRDALGMPVKFLELNSEEPVRELLMSYLDSRIVSVKTRHMFLKSRARRKT